MFAESTNHISLGILHQLECRCFPKNPNLISLFLNAGCKAEPERFTRARLILRKTIGNVIESLHTLQVSRPVCVVLAFLCSREVAKGCLIEPRLSAANKGRIQTL